MNPNDQIPETEPHDPSDPRRSLTAAIRVHRSHHVEKISPHDIAWNEPALILLAIGIDPGQARTEAGLRQLAADAVRDVPRYSKWLYP